MFRLAPLTFLRFDMICFIGCRVTQVIGQHISNDAWKRAVFLQFWGHRFLHTIIILLINIDSAPFETLHQLTLTMAIFQWGAAPSEGVEMLSWCSKGGGHRDGHTCPVRVRVADALLLSIITVIDPKRRIVANGLRHYSQLAQTVSNHCL